MLHALSALLDTKLDALKSDFSQQLVSVQNHVQFLGEQMETLGGRVEGLEVCAEGGDFDEEQYEDEEGDFEGFIGGSKRPSKASWKKSGNGMSSGIGFAEAMPTTMGQQPAQMPTSEQTSQMIQLEMLKVLKELQLGRTQPHRGLGDEDDEPFWEGVRHLGHASSKNIL